MVLGTWTTRMRPRAFSSSFMAENAVSSPPMVMSCDDVEPQQRDDGVLEVLGVRAWGWRARCRCAIRRGSGCG